eukprot:5292064-Pleurochrysis_carterae.AAC.2
MPNHINKREEPPKRSATEQHVSSSGARARLPVLLLIELDHIGRVVRARVRRRARDLRRTTLPCSVDAPEKEVEFAQVAKGRLSVEGVLLVQTGRFI